MHPDTAERWRQVDALLDAALDGTPGDAMSAAPEVHAEVQRLLELRSSAERFLNRPAAEVAAGLLLSHESSSGGDHDALPERIGPYRVLSVAGRGGMATVYLAERDEPEFRQRVAVKVMREGVAGATLERRFITERQILASFEHPGIARLFDGGVTEERRPWFAMEYVDGAPITHFCDERRLGVDARLALFLEVCDAVQYAHRHLVVHRDLKPSNILVAEPLAGETRGRVKLLDFGIARLLAPAAAADTGDAGLTHTGLNPLTPEYASPEQLKGDAVSTASDVYQLGILLYVLLTGRRPYRVEGLPLHEVHRVVLEDGPEPPSVVMTRSAPDRLRRRLRGDLDNIVLMALRKDPERRYPSVEHLADDVRRHLAREPVRARPDTLRYRAGRFIHRHRVGVASAAITLLLIVTSAAALAVQAARVARERDRAEQVTAFLVDMFQGFEPVEARGVSVTIRDVLRRGVERARTELAGQPLLRATVLDAIGQVSELQGLHAEAEPLLEEALNLRLAALGPDHLDVARSRQRVAALRYERGNYDVESLYQSALATFRARLGAGSPEAVQAVVGLALLYRARGRYAAADSLLNTALQAARASEALSVDLPIALLFLGKLRTRAGDYGQAQRWLREALALRRELFGREHPGVANAIDALGELELARGRADSAEAFFREALAIRRTLYDGGHTDIASGLTYLARARAEQGDLPTADSLLREALPVFRGAFGDDSPDVAEVLEHLGATRLAGGDLVAADSLFGRALAIWRAKPVESAHDRVATLRMRIGNVLLRRGDLDRARAVLEEALALRRSALPEGHWEVAEIRSLLGACLSALGRFDEAEALLIAAHADISAVRGDEDRAAREALRRLREHYERARAGRGA